MKHLIQIILSVLILHSCLFSVQAKAEDWVIYSSYHNHTKAVKTDSRIFVLANNNLFSYDTEDELVELYDKSNVISDFGIQDIAYSKAAKSLFILYNNSNIDILSLDGYIWNLPDLKNKALNDKSLNELRVINNEALISTGSGLALVNISKQHFTDFYAFDSNVSNATIANGKIYAKTKNGVYEGNRKDNLLDKNNWKKLSATPSGVTFGPSDEEKAEAAEMLKKVEDITINSPLRNYSYNLNMVDGKLLVAGGNFFYPNINHEGTVMKYENETWSAFDETKAIELVGKDGYMNVTDVVVSKDNPNKYFVGTRTSGIFEFDGDKLTKHYGLGNSPLTSILPTSKNAANYVRVTALEVDHDGNLWMCNNECDTIVRILKKDGSWKSLYYNEIAGYPTFDHTVFDKRGWAWISQRRTTASGHIAGLMIIDTNGTIDNTSDDHHRFLSSFKNQDGTSYTPNLFYCMTEDLDGAMWIGTSDGLFVSYDPSQVFTKDFYLSQVKVPRNDGTNLADYLLNGASISCITIDGGNRKWIGTNGNGVYLISADGLQTIEHFTKDNSSLISDNINDIAIDGKSGEVFIATELGLCSYHGDATDPAPSMNDKSLKVYPNPVRPEYTGDVHVTGMMINSIVKVVSASGKLVAEGTSVGGQFNWNCCTASGKKVAPGIYYILATDENGNKGACAKVVIIK
ncbi:MAG: Por secretion system protein [Prevotellaceae bacterium]|nr:Por secretion system protein [Candidatus Minthosoma caballi]